MKFLKYLFVCLSLAVVSSTFVSCEKEDDEPYFAGESEADFKPAVYTVTSEWDLSGISGLTADQKKALETQLKNQINDSAEFPTRAAAVAEFDIIIEKMRTDATLKNELKGGKATIKLMRGTAIIKQAKLTW